MAHRVQQAETAQPCARTHSRSAMTGKQAEAYLVMMPKSRGSSSPSSTAAWTSASQLRSTVSAAPADVLDTSTRTDSQLPNEH
eukprot:SM000101S09308  [mRNA]  locus=s101:454330:454735:- [translate_table: standard]